MDELSQLKNELIKSQEERSRLKRVIAQNQSSLATTEKMIDKLTIKIKNLEKRNSITSFSIGQIYVMENSMDEDLRIDKIIDINDNYDVIVKEYVLKDSSFEGSNFQIFEETIISNEDLDLYFEGALEISEATASKLIQLAMDFNYTEIKKVLNKVI